MDTSEETKALTEAAERLRVRFPTAPAETIDKVVDDNPHEFDGTPIRDFIPVLVERQTTESLLPTQRRADTSV